METIYALLEELGPEYNFRESKNYVEDGLLDSFDIVSPITSLEEMYHISVDGLDVIPENFETAEAIRNLVIKCGGKIE